MAMQEDIDKEISRLKPPGGVAAVMLSRHEYEQLVRKAVTAGTLIGWVNGESFARERFERQQKEILYELTNLRDRVKELEMEIIAASK